MKHLFTLFYFCLLFSLSHAQSVVYVTQNGSGNQSGGSWSDALPGTQLHPRLASAAAGTQFWITSGTYKPTTGTDRSISFSVPSGVQVYGGFAGNEATLANRTLTSPSSTTLSGEIGDQTQISDNTYHVVRLTNVSASTRLDGLTITGGNANVSSMSEESVGGGIYHRNNQSSVESSSVITNCYIINNRAGYGGGVENTGTSNAQGNLTFTNCTFKNNSATGGDGGALHSITGNGRLAVTLENCLFENNTAPFHNGGAIASMGSNDAKGIVNTILKNCTFTQNSAQSGGAILLAGFFGRSTALISGCKFYRNAAKYNGGAIISVGYYSGIANLKLDNSLFAFNSASTGGAINSDGDHGICNAELKNCTIAYNYLILPDNNVDNGSGALSNTNSSGTCSSKLTNCLLWENSTRYALNRTGILNEGTVTVIVNYSNIQGGFAGTGNIDADPQFVDAANGDYRLKAGSPAINAGDPGSTATTISDKDLAGNPRIVQDRIDMGAYEFQVTSQNNADLSLNLRVNSRTSNLNQPVTYRLTVTNEGPTTATNVVWQNRLPDNLVYVGGSNLSLNNGVLSGQLASLAAGASATFTYQLQPSQPGQYRNAAQITAADQPDPDSQPNSGTGDGQDDTSMGDFRAGGGTAVYASANPNQTPLPNVQSNQPAPDPTKADLSLAMFVSNRTPKVGEVITVSITVSNAGGLPANGVTAQLVLPNGVTFVSGSEVSQFDALGVNASVTRTLQVRVAGQGSLSLRAEISNSDQPDPDSRPNSGPDGEDDTAIVELRVQPAL